MIENLLIRIAHRSDIQALSALAKKTYSDAFGHSFTPKDLKTYLEKDCSEDFFYNAMKRDMILLACLDTRLLGYIKFGAVGIPAGNYSDQDKELHRIYVDTDFQGQGIGTLLMNSALQHPILKKAKNIYLDVWNQNHVALKFYQNFGFEVISQHFPFPNGDPDLIMARRSN